MAPQVSVVIPTYHRAEFLRGAVRSVLGQTFEDFEVVVVDDGGPDGAAEVIEGFNDSRIRYLRHPERRGGAAARNTGIANARGEYVAFLDDDDEWLEEKLERQMRMMLASPRAVGAVYTGYYIVDRSSGRTCGRIIPRKRGRLYPAILAGNCVGGTSSVLVRKSSLERSGLFDETLPSFQDYDLWIRIARHFEFDCIAEPMLKYFMQPDKIWTDVEALRQGLDIMLGKYGSSPSFRKKSSSYCIAFGVRFCEKHQFEQARKSFLKAAMLSPLDARPYVYLALACLGSRRFERAQIAKAKLLGKLRKSLSPGREPHA
ncbi:MAG TPA: glycosyltransferase family 2 protein [Candidatus Eisenbacteria bacterium]|nr:glycosyltransferase family 2 protein [Candidatus Eisenbacteria bacterium]